MIKTLLALVSCLVFILAVDLILGKSILWYWTPQSDINVLKLYALATDPKQFDILILGSSTSNRGLMPKVIEEELSRSGDRESPVKVFNASVDAAFLPVYMDAMRNIVGRLQKPKLVLLMLGVRDFNAAGGRLSRHLRFFTRDPRDAWLVLRHAPDMDERWSVLRGSLQGIEVLIQYPIILRYGVRVAEFQRRQGGVYVYPFEGDGLAANKQFLPPPEKTPEELRDDRGEAARDVLFKDFQINAMIDAWMDEIISEARKKNSRLVILLSPESEWFRQNAYHGERKLVEDYLEGWRQKTGLVWYDLDQKPFQPDDSQYFDGCDHLGPVGAVVLSRQVARHIILVELGRRVPRAEEDAGRPEAGQE